MDKEITEKFGYPNIYKFRANYDFILDELANNYLYFSNRLELNDPFDCFPKLVEIDPKSEDLRKVVVKQLIAKEGVSRQVARKEARSYSSEELIESYRQSFLEIIDKAAICSFVPLFSSLMMWNHYADCYKGLCFGFNMEKDSDFFSDRKAVDYISDFKPKKIERPDEARFIFRTKSDDWSQEKEIRLVSPEKGKFHFNPDSLSFVIFGPKTSQENINQVASVCTGKYHNLEFYKSEPSTEIIGIQIQKMKIK